MNLKRVLMFIAGLCVTVASVHAQRPPILNEQTADTGGPVKFDDNYNTSPAHDGNNGGFITGTPGSNAGNTNGGGSTGSGTTGGNDPEPGHKTLYVHGLKPFHNLTSCQDQPTCTNGWHAQKYTGPTVRHVGYFTLSNPTYASVSPSMESGSVQLLKMLNKYCRKDQNQTCDLICGSMGCLTISYVLSEYNDDGKYNALQVTALASAEGGSEVATIGSATLLTMGTFFGGLFGAAWTAAIINNSFLAALTPAYIRNRFDHNDNNGTIFYHKAGNSPLTALNWIWKGSHDRMVSFHSACGYRNNRKFTQCGGQSFTTSQWKWVQVWIRGKLRWRYRKITTTTTYQPYTGHQASGQISNTGISGASHGYMSHNELPQKRY